MSDLTKPPSDTSYALVSGKLKTKASGFKARIAEAAKQANAIDPQTMPNRICLMLDCSGSMSYDTPRRIDLLKDAVANFVTRCNFVDTSVAIATFPSSHTGGGPAPLSANGSQIIAYTMGFDAGGGTPLHECMVRSIEDVSMTRGVIVSDGGATDWRESIYDEEESRKDVLKLYKDAHIPVDTVHISQDTDGEDLLRRIAKETGGIFIKFSDVSAFSKAFGYLAPSYRAMLTSGSVSASELGAKEIK